jgi:acetyl-CoA carboxylase carboxyl transferase subunit alpha
LKLTATAALDFGLVDEIIEEPKGGAHRKPIEVFASVIEAITRHLAELGAKTAEQVKEERFVKFRTMGQFDVA